MSLPFGSRYAAIYDSLYADKDYKGECDLLEHLFARFASVPVRRVLDLGCGTGAHARELARRGYTVVGVDRSQEMLESARKTSPESTFIQGDITSFELDESFDAVVLLFAVLGYQLAPSDVIAALSSARRQLVPGGIVAFDVWYGPAVVAQRPGSRVRESEIDGRRFVRTSKSMLDTDRQVVEVEFEVSFPDAGEPPIRELHAMRYFFPLELQQDLDQSGFDLLRIGGFPAFDQDPDERTWSVLVAGRAR